MEEILKPVDCQYLLIQVLKVLEPETLMALARNLSEKVSDALQKEYIIECISFANESRKNPEYCTSFDSSCRSILARQKQLDEKQIGKQEYIDALGTNRMQMSRIERGEAQMKEENIAKICKDFERECDKRFWQNHLLTFFPGILLIYKDDNNNKDTVEYKSLVKVIESLRENEYQSVVESLPEPDRLKIAGAFEKDQYVIVKDPLGDQPCSLYETIRHIVRNTPSVTLESLVIDELQTTMQSWYDWKGRWNRAEEAGFAYVPKPSLRRKHLLLIAAVCGLEYLDTVRLLQTGGYRLGLTGSDSVIVNCFLKRTLTARERINIIYKYEM